MNITEVTRRGNCALTSQENKGSLLHTKGQYSVVYTDANAHRATKWAVRIN